MQKLNAANLRWNIMEAVVKFLSEILPRIKTPIQIIGLAIGAFLLFAIFVADRSFPPQLLIFFYGTSFCLIVLGLGLHVSLKVSDKIRAYIVTVLVLGFISSIGLITTQIDNDLKVTEKISSGKISISPNDAAKYTLACSNSSDWLRFVGFDTNMFPIDRGNAIVTMNDHQISKMTWSVENKHGSEIYFEFFGECHKRSGFG